MACYVIVRQTLDWERATPDDLFDDFARETARTWERTFKTSYVACRASGDPQGGLTVTPRVRWMAGVRHARNRP